eukprot:TRINITY_DN7867_c0_g1_i3.p1 TRINITY_DN7867_c0_g1~~TRINITY_DN7867_c0_g1_i3.p1  ORF type:complete len:665 (-),score=93.41 TRINITY_DN7867_c0_g1_i3:79-2073(-)
MTQVRPSRPFFQDADLKYLELGKSPLCYDTLIDTWASFDEVHKHVIFYSPGRISWQPFFHPRTRSPFVQIQHYGPIISARLAVDGSYLCYQISLVEVALRSVLKGFEFTYKCQKMQSGNQIMAIIWTHINELVLVTKLGLEFLKVSTSRPSVKLVRNHPIDVSWFVYSHESRLLVVGSPPAGKVLHPFHFPPGSVIKLPRFDLTIEPDSYVQSNEVYITQIYGVLYFIHIDPERRKVSLYQIAREEVKLRRVFDLPVGHDFSCSVIDNILIVHSLDSKVSMVFDLKSSPDVPMSLPSVITFHSHDRHHNKTGANSPPIDHGALSPTQSPEVESSNGYHSPSDSTAKAMTATAPDIYTGDGFFFLPNILFDPAKGMIFDVRINLSELSKDLSDKPRMIHFLLRRAHGKGYALKLLRTAVEHMENLSEIAALFDSINRIYKTVVAEKLRELAIRHNRQGVHSKTDLKLAGLSGMASPSAQEEMYFGDGYFDVSEQVTLGLDEAVPWEDGSRGGVRAPRYDTSIDGLIVIDQDDIYKHVFCQLGESKMVEFKPLMAVCVEYIRSLMGHGLKVQHHVYQFLIELLVQNKAFYQLYQFLQYHVITDSLPVACQLLSLESKYRPAAQVRDFYERTPFYSIIHLILLDDVCILLTLHSRTKVSVIHVLLLI